MALGLGEPLITNKYKRKIVCCSLSKDQVRKSDDSDMIFSLDEDHLENNVTSDNATRTCIENPATLRGDFERKIQGRYNAFILSTRWKDREISRQPKFIFHLRKYIDTGEWWIEWFHPQFRNGSFGNCSRAHYGIRR
ncbi:uncharacterized protein [Temnothorax longispinosus]|uniref:uncharacterized protein n=1 Tax=Temnothorax longispinosus TaxID=300112 RepID=UPI003A9935D6